MVGFNMFDINVFFKKSVFLLFIFGICCGQAHAGEEVNSIELLQLAEKKYYGINQQIDYREAFNLYLKAAELGNVCAQYYVAQMYNKGKGVEQNSVKAIEWYTKAAEQGHAEAQYKLAAELDDFSSSLIWYSKAAKQGHARAQYQTGLWAFLGIGTDASNNNKNDDSLKNKSLPEMMTAAFSWYKKAADQGDADAQYELGQLYANNDFDQYDLEKSIIWYKKAIDNGNISAAVSLAECYRYGIGIEKNPAKAFELYKKILEEGSYPNVQYEIALMYEEGVGVKQDTLQALAWYLVAAENGSLKAREKMGDLYYHGTFVEQNYAKAFKWYEQAKTLKSMYMKGYMYYYGQGVEQNGKKAIKPLETVAGIFPEAQYLLGVIYEEGAWVRQDYKKAKEWYGKACDKGLQKGCFAYKKLNK